MRNHIGIVPATSLNSNRMIRKAHSLPAGRQVREALTVATANHLDGRSATADVVAAGMAWGLRRRTTPVRGLETPGAEGAPLPDCLWRVDERRAARCLYSIRPEG